MNFEDNKGLFIEEARELICAIETSLLVLEKEPDREDLVNEVFRALHTIKGSGAMFGFEDMTAFAHGLESLFDDIRKGALAITGDIIGIGLRSLDCLSGLLEGNAPDELQADIVRRVAAVRGALSDPAAPVDPASSGSASEESDDSGLAAVYRIHFKPDADMLHRGVKVENLFKELSEAGTVYASASIDAVPALERLDPTALYLSWIVTVSTTKSEADISSIFLFVEDYANLRIEKLPITDPDGQSAVPLLGELLAERGALTHEDITELRRKQKPFGELAVESGKIDETQLNAALAEQGMAKAASLQRETRKESASIRVRKEKLDYLVDTVGELVILEARLRQEARLSGSIAFAAIAEDLDRLTADLRDATMSVRMVPLEESFSGFQRLVRDLGAQLGKDLQLTISGASTEMDKNIIESLKDPLVHIIRNSADHGIEAPDERARLGKPVVGTIGIEARQQGSRVEIAISDDGAGLDLERIRSKGLERGLIDANERDPKRLKMLVFEPGFSTAARTTGVSGRGVGMDVVKSNLDKLRGDIDLESEPGKGTRITLSIPLTLVIVDGLLVRVGDVHYVLNLNQVEECVDDAIGRAPEEPARSVINLRGRTIPVVDMRRVLGVAREDAGYERRMVIADSDGAPVALWVDAVVGKQQVVIKPFTMDMRHVSTVAGATVLGDGSVALILNLKEIIKAQRRDERLASKESL